MEVLEIFPLRIVRPLALLSFTGLPKQEASTQSLFHYFFQNGISIAFLVEGSDKDENRNLVLAISQEELIKRQTKLEALGKEIQAETVVVEEPVALIRILGPHFDIRPSIAGHLFGNLMKAGIRVLANSTTITSSLLIIPDNQVEQTVRVLKSIFRLPKSK
jgi:aspartate kinase